MAEHSFVMKTNDNDVFLGRGKKVNSQSGNIRFRKIAGEYALEYTQTEKKYRKDELARTIVQSVHDSGGRFLRGVTVSNAKQEHRAAWEIVSDDIVFTKAKQAMRDAAASYTKSERRMSSNAIVPRSLLQGQSEMHCPKPPEMAWMPQDTTSLQNLQAPPLAMMTGSSENESMLRFLQQQQHPPLYPPVRNTSLSSPKEQLLSMVNTQTNMTYPPSNIPSSTPALDSLLNASLHQQQHRPQPTPPTNTTYPPSNIPSSTPALDARLNASLQQQQHRLHEVMQRQQVPPTSRSKIDALLNASLQQQLRQREAMQQPHYVSSNDALASLQQFRHRERAHQEALLLQHQFLQSQLDNRFLHQRLAAVGPYVDDDTRRQQHQLLSNEGTSQQLTGQRQHDQGSTNASPTERGTKRSTSSFGATASCSGDREEMVSSLKRKRTHPLLPDFRPVAADAHAAPHALLPLAVVPLVPQEERAMMGFHQTDERLLKRQSSDSETSHSSTSTRKSSSVSSSQYEKKPRARS